jgi:integrase
MANKTRVPKYCLHKTTGQAYSRVKGRFVYHGQYGTEESKDNYDRFVCDFLANGRKLPQNKGITLEDATLNSVCLGFLKHVENYGYSDKEVEAFKMAVKRFRSVFGRTLAKNFGPLNLQSFQQILVEDDCSRRYVNRTISKVRRIFKWGTAQELIPPGVHEGLKAVENLKRGRTTAKDYDPVAPVSDAIIKKTVKYLQRIPSDMVWFQRYTGCRSGEMVIMRPIDIDQSGEVWVYTPSKHKTEHHGKSRSVYIGPKAQAVLLHYLEDRPPESYVFSPKEAADDRSKLLRESHYPQPRGA